MWSMSETEAANSPFEILKDPHKKEARKLLNRGIKLYKKKEINLAFNFFQRAVQQNALTFGFTQVVNFISFKKVKMDAINYFLDQGDRDPYALAIVGFLYLYTKTNSDDNQFQLFGLRRLIEAAKQGVFSAVLELKKRQCDLGNEADTVFECSAENNPLTLLCLGKMYLYGLGVEKDETMAFAYLTLAAEKNDPTAFLYLSIRYFYGISVEKDEEKAYQYLIKAVDQQHPLAIKELANLAKVGHLDALELLKKLAEDNNSLALFYLAKMHLDGQGIEENVSLAINYFHRLAKAGSKKAIRYLSKLAENNNPCALNAMNDLIEQDNLRARRYLGKIFLRGGLSKEKGKKITSEDLRAILSSVSTAEIANLNAFLKQHSEITELYFNEDDGDRLFKEERWEESVSEILQHNAQIASLELWSSSEFPATLVSDLAKFQSLTSIHLALFPLDFTTVNAIVVNRTCLVDFGLTENQLFTNAEPNENELNEFEVFLTSLANLPRLNKFQFRNQNVYFPQAKLLFDILLPKLNSLDLGDNRISDEGAIYLANKLKENQGLIELDIDNNQIGNSGAEHLAQALKVNSYLTRLNLVMNFYDIKGLEYLADSLKNNTHLKKLELDCYRDNDDDNGIQYITNALLENNSLTILTTSLIITNEGADKLISALSKNFSLLQLLSSSNPTEITMSEDKKEKIDNLLAENQSIAAEENPIEKAKRILKKSDKMLFPSLLSICFFKATIYLKATSEEERAKYLACLPQELSEPIKLKL